MQQSALPFVMCLSLLSAWASKDPSPDRYPSAESFQLCTQINSPTDAKISRALLDGVQEQPWSSSFLLLSDVDHEQAKELDLERGLEWAQRYHDVDHRLDSAHPRGAVAFSSFTVGTSAILLGLITENGFLGLGGASLLGAGQSTRSSAHRRGLDLRPDTPVLLKRDKMDELIRRLVAAKTYADLQKIHPAQVAFEMDLIDQSMHRTLEMLKTSQAGNVRQVTTPRALYYWLPQYSVTLERALEINALGGNQIREKIHKQLGKNKAFLDQMLVSAGLNWFPRVA